MCQLDRNCTGVYSVLELDAWLTLIEHKKYTATSYELTPIFLAFAEVSKMATAANISVADRLVQVFDHLGIGRVHFAASMLADVAGLIQAYPERIASLALICPPRLDPSLLRWATDY